MLTGMKATKGTVMASKGIKIGQPYMLQMAKPGYSSSKGGKASASTKTKGPTRADKVVALTVGTRNIPVKHALSYMGIRKGGMNSRNGNKEKLVVDRGRATLVNAEPQLSLVSLVESKNETTTTLSDQGNNSYVLLNSTQLDYRD